MKLIAHTPLGVFESIELGASESEIVQSYFISQVTTFKGLDYLSFSTSTGRFYMSKEMIAQSVFTTKE